MGKYVCRVKTVSRGGENTMTVQAIITSFYDGLTQKNNEWQKNVSESIVFSDASQKLHAEGKEAFIQSFTTFLRAVEKVHMKQLIVEETNACAVVSYDYISPQGGKLHQDDAEIWKVVDGKIVALTIYFDITEFRSFMGR
jgi:ketosteroid isomerase-like protein